MTNLFNNERKPLKRSGKNPERINQLSQIIQPKLKVFIGTSIVCLGTLIGWSFVGSIPITVNGKATFVKPESLIELKAETEGILVFTSDLLESSRNDLYGLTIILENEMAELNSNEKNIDNFISRIDSLIAASNHYIRITLLAQSFSNDVFHSKRKNKSSSLVNFSGELKMRKNEPIAYILNADKASSFLDNLSKYRTGLANLKREKANHRILSATATQLKDERLKQLNVIQELFNKGILPETDLFQSKRDLLDAEKELINEDLSLSSSIAELRDKGSQIRSTLYKALQKVEVLAPAGSKTISRLAESGTTVKTDQAIAIVTTARSDSNPQTITGVFPMRSVQGLASGLPVLVNPENADINTYGSILGKIDSVSKVPIDKSNAVFKVGSTARASSLYEDNQTMSLTSIVLESSGNQKYNWSSSSGPTYPIPIGTQANVTVITGSRKPISVLLPFIREVTGQK